MIRSVLRSTVRMKLGEATATFWTDAMLNQWMDDGQKDIVQKAKLKRTRGTFDTLPNTARYTLTSIFPNFMRVVDGGVWIYDDDSEKWFKVNYATKEEMNRMYQDWPNADTDTYSAWVTSTAYIVGDLIYVAGDPTVAYVCATAHTSGTWATDLAAGYWTVSTWDISGVPQNYMEDLEENILELYPVPQPSCVGEDYCRVYYSKKPTPMASDASSPDLDTQGLLEPALIEYVVATGFESRGYGDLANDHWSKYYDKIRSFMTEKDNKEDEEIIMKNERNI